MSKIRQSIIRIQSETQNKCRKPVKLRIVTKILLFIEEANDPSLGKFSKLLKCMMREQSKEPGGLSNVDWSQWQSVAGSGQFPNQKQNWNPSQPSWIRPGQQQPPQQPQWPQQPQPGVMIPGQNQPRPGVHPDDYNNNNRNSVPPQPPQQPGPGWPPQQRPPPPEGPPPGWNEGERGRNKNERKKNRRKNNNFVEDEDMPMMIPSPDPSLGSGLMNPPPTGPQWGTNVGAINDEESQTMTRNRQYGYALMACAVVALAVLMVIDTN